MKRNKLCFIIPVFDPRTTSHYLHVYELIEEVASTVEIFVFAESGENNIQIKNIAGAYTQRFHWLFARIIERWMVFTLLRLRGFSTFYCHYAFTSCLVAKFVTFALGGKTVLWMCVKEHLYKEKLSLSSLGKKLSKEWPIVYALRHTDKLVTCSSAMKKYYRSVFRVPSDKIIIIPNWVDVDRFDPKRFNRLSQKKKLGLEKKKVVAYIHWFSERKGADRLPEIIDKLIKKRNDVHFLLVGAGPLQSTIKEDIKRRKLEKYTTFMAGVPNLNIPACLAASDVLLVPSHTEEFGRIFLEAMAMGTPIVTTETEGATTVLTKTQQRYMIAQRKNNKLAEEICEKIIKVLDDPAATHELIREGKKRVKQFSLNRVTAQFIKNVAKQS